jgi:cell division protease FtsH
MCNLIDSQITKLVKSAESNADDILTKNIDQLHAIAKALLEFETIDGNDLSRLVNGEKIVKINPAKLSYEKPRRRRSKKDKTSENPSL